MKLADQVFVAIAVFIALILLGAYGYHTLEGWRYLDSLYFTVITVTTVGYGDFSPQTDYGKIFTMFFVFLGIVMASYFISLGGKYILRKNLRSQLKEAGRLNGKKGVRRIRKR